MAQLQSEASALDIPEESGLDGLNPGRGNLSATNQEGLKPVHASRRCEKIPLSIAAEEGDLEEVKRLVSHGAILGREDAKRKRAVHYAAEKGHLPVIKYLCEQGAD